METLLKQQQPQMDTQNSAPGPDKGRVFCVMGKAGAAVGGGTGGSGDQSFVCCMNTSCMAGHTHWRVSCEFVWTVALHGLGQKVPEGPK